MKKSKNNAALPASVVAESRRVWSQSNAPLRGRDDDFNHRFETGGGVSKTIPDQSYSIQELFRRSQTGLTVNQNSPIYSDDDIAPFEKMDFAERVDFLNHVKQFRNELEAKFKADDAADRAAKVKADLEAKEAADADFKKKVKEAQDAG